MGLYAGRGEVSAVAQTTNAHQKDSSKISWVLDTAERLLLEVIAYSLEPLGTSRIVSFTRLTTDLARPKLYT